jgi:uncharacterized protein (TIGR02246 family)
MNHHCRLLSVLFAASLLAACAHPAPAPAPPASNAAGDIAAINAARQAFVNAYNAGDAEAMGKLYTEDAVSEPNHQPTLVGRQAIVDSLKRMFDQVAVKVELTSEEVKTSGDAGFDRGRYKAEVTPKAEGGTPTSIEGRDYVIYTRQADGTWLAARDMDNAPGPTEPEAPAADAPPSK